MRRWASALPSSDKKRKEESDRVWDTNSRGVVEWLEMPERNAGGDHSPMVSNGLDGRDGD